MTSRLSLLFPYDKDKQTFYFSLLCIYTICSKSVPSSRGSQKKNGQGTRLIKRRFFRDKRFTSYVFKRNGPDRSYQHSLIRSLRSITKIPPQILKTKDQKL